MSRPQRGQMFIEKNDALKDTTPAGVEHQIIFYFL